MNTILPETPGRERRLAYGNYIRNINRINSNRVRVNRNRIELNSFVERDNDIMVIGNNFQDTFNIRRQGRRINGLNGLLLKDLYKNSSVYFKKENMFQLKALIFRCSYENHSCLKKKLLKSMNFL